jgi:hypothetical protein
VADGTLWALNHDGLPLNLPVAAALPSQDFKVVVTGDTGAVITATAWFTDGSAAQQLSFALGNGKASSVVFRRAWSGVSTVKFQRQDTKTALSASVFVRF